MLMLLEYVMLDAGCAASAVRYVRRLHLAVGNIVKLDPEATGTFTAKVNISNREMCVRIAYPYAVKIGRIAGKVCDVPALYDVGVGVSSSSRGNSIGRCE